MRPRFIPWRQLDVKSADVVELDNAVPSERLRAASLGLARQVTDMEAELTGVRDELAVTRRRCDQHRRNAEALERRCDDLLKQLAAAQGRRS